MRNVYLIAVILGLSGSTSAQAPYWEWAKRIGGVNYENISAIASDNAGNVYVTGMFQSPTITIDTFTLTDTANLSMYVVKYNSAGQVVWVRSPIGGNPYAFSICADANENVYVTGVFHSEPITFGNITLQNSSYEDVYLVKYDKLGNVVWAKSDRSTIGSSARTSSLTTDGRGHLYMCGGVFSGANDSLSFGSQTLPDGSAALYTLFVAAYDTSGNALWLKSPKGASIDDWMASISTDAAGSVYVSGYFNSPSLIFGTDTVVNQGSYDFFAAKYDASGNPIWGRGGGSSGDDRGQGVTVSRTGQVYVTGSFESDTMTVGASTCVNQSTGGLADIFLVRYDTQGRAKWARSAGGTSGDGTSGVTTDAAGNVYLSGYFASPSLVIGGDTLINSQSNAANVLVAKYDSLGHAGWAIEVEGSQINAASGICTDVSGNVCITGYYQSPSVTFGNYTVANAGGSDIFISKLHLAVAKPEGIEARNNTVGGIKIYPNPSSSVFYIDGINARDVIEIYDILGQSVLPAQRISDGNDMHTVNLSGRNKGVYFYKITASDGHAQQGKLVLQ